MYIERCNFPPEWDDHSATFIMVVFGMTGPGREPTTYHMHERRTRLPPRHPDRYDRRKCMDMRLNITRKRQNVTYF